MFWITRRRLNQQEQAIRHVAAALDQQKDLLGSLVEAHNNLATMVQRQQRQIDLICQVIGGIASEN